MKHYAIATVAVGSILMAGGCATKKYVRNTTDPIQQQVTQVSDQTKKQSATLDETRKDLDTTRKDVERNETEISAAKERAMSADTHAGEAMASADKANQKADKNGRDLSELRQQVSDLDNYKPVAEEIVSFGFNKDTLTPDAKEKLDKLASERAAMKRYFIAIEGFTDRKGSAKYNESLSRRRADQVAEYLVAKHEIPVYRIHEIGLGKEKPVDEGRSKASQAKNRRVEVTIYSADGSVTAMNRSSDGASAPATPAPRVNQ